MRECLGKRQVAGLANTVASKSDRGEALYPPPVTQTWTETPHSRTNLTNHDMTQEEGRMNYKVLYDGVTIECDKANEVLALVDSIKSEIHPHRCSRETCVPPDEI